MRNPILLIVLIVAGLLVLMGANGRLTALPDARQAPAADEFHAPRAKARLARILGDEAPHPADTPANDEVRERLIGQLMAIGLEPQVRDEMACNEHYKSRGVTCARVRNVVATIGPAAGRHLLLSAHYDSSPAGPGASDAGAGVATLLEVAYLLRNRRLDRPVTFLFNEGEELGLVGARAFIERDPIADRVDSLINLEARGVTGPAHMFETNTPNGAAIAAFSRSVRDPVANSLSTDVYRLMPNYTDVNTFNSRDWTTLNFGIIGNETRYHSAGDNLAALDTRSLQHMGDQALALAIDLSRGVSETSGNWIFMDLLGRELLTLPLVAGLTLLAALAVGLAWMAWRRKAIGRGLATVTGALVLSTALGFAGESLVGLLRPGMFWRAEPIWSHLAAYASAILATLVMLSTLGRGLQLSQLRTAFWLAYVLIGAAIALVAPGGIVFFLLPPLLLLLGALAGPGIERWAAFAAILLLYLTFGVMLAHLEELLSRGPIWLLAPLGSLLLTPALIEAHSLVRATPRAQAIGIGAAFVLLGWVAAAITPAYSADRQQQFSIEHITDHDKKRAYWSVLNDFAPLPREFTRVGKWTMDDLPHSERKRWLAPAAVAGVESPAVQVMGSRTIPGGRHIRVRLAANGAQSITLIAPKDAGIRAAGSGSYVRPIDAEAGDGRYFIRCFGRSCDGFALDLVIGNSQPIDFIVAGWTPGLPASAQPLIEARPRDARPQYAADATMTLSRIRL